MVGHEDLAKLLYKVLESQNETSRLATFPGIGSDYGFSGAMPSAQVTSAPGQLAGIAPLLQLAGIELPEVLTKNFHMKPNTQTSALFNSLVEQNTSVSKELEGNVMAMQGERIAGFFGKNSAIRSLFGDDFADMAEGAFRGTSGGVSGVAAQLATPMLSKMLYEMTGYDVGEGANVIGGKSPGMVTGMRALRGGPFKAGMSPEAALSDILEGDYANERMAASSMALSAVQGMRFNRDEEGNIIGPNKKMHGASGNLVAQIVTDAIGNGSFDREFSEPGNQDRMLEALSKIDTDGDGGQVARLLATADSRGIRMSDISDTQADLFRERNDIQTIIRKKKAEKADMDAEALAASKRVGSASTEAEKGKAEEEKKAAEDSAQKLDGEIKELESKFKAVSTTISKVGDLVKDGGGDLVESVTGAVESLKDLYGSETAATRALQSMVGTAGMTDKGLAKAIKKASDEYKMTAFAAGVDPLKAGAYLGENITKASKGWGTDRIQGTAAMGQLGMDMSIMAMRGAAGIADPEERERYLRSQSAMTQEVGNSEGFKAAIMLEHAKERHKFEGRGELEDKVRRLMSTGDSKDFERAKRIIMQVAGNGDEELGRMMFEDPRIMADIARETSTEGTARAAEWATSTNQKELSGMVGTETRRVREQRAADKLFQAGFSQRAVDKLTTRADTAARKSWISDMKASGKDAQKYEDLEAAAKRAYDAAIASGASEEQAQDAANRALLADPRMTEADRQAYKKASTEARINEYSGAFGGNVDTGKLKTEAGEQIMDDLKAVGAVGTDKNGKTGVLTGENLAKFMSTTMNQLSSGTFRDKEGNLITSEKVFSTQKQVDDLMRKASDETDPKKKEYLIKQARSAWSALYSSLDDESRRAIVAGNDAVYETPEQVAARKELTDKEKKDEARIKEDRGRIVKGLEKSGLMKDGRIDDTAVSKLKEEEKVLRETFSKENYDEYDKLRRSVGAEGKSRYEKLSEGAEQRTKDIEEKTKALESYKGGDLTDEQKKEKAAIERDLAKLKKDDEEYKDLRLYHDKSYRESLKEDDPLRKKADEDIARYGELDNQLFGKDAENKKKRLSDISAKLRDVNALNAQDAALESYENKRKTGESVDDKRVAAARTAGRLEMSRTDEGAGNAYSAASQAEGASAVNIGTSAGAPEVQQKINDAESAGNAENAGAGGKIEAFLKQLNPEELKKAMAGTEKAFEQFGVFVQNILTRLDIPTVSAESGSEGASKDTKVGGQPVASSGSPAAGGASSQVVENGGGHGQSSGGEYIAAIDRNTEAANALTEAFNQAIAMDSAKAAEQVVSSSA